MGGKIHIDGPNVRHISSAHPYCDRLRELALEVGQEQEVTIHDGGTVVVIQGPRFSSKSESRWFSGMGWDVINMTQYPEVILQGAWYMLCQYCPYN